MWVSFKTRVENDGQTKWGRWWQEGNMSETDGNAHGTALPSSRRALLKG
jgi:hypothetical protein